TAKKISGNSCGRTGYRTEFSNPSTTLSITAATPGTRSSISRGKSCPSPAAIGQPQVTQSEDWYYSCHPILRRPVGRGQLSGIIIDEAEGLPSSSAYRLRFGSLLRAYQLVGFRPRRDYRYIEINRLLRKLHPGIIDEIIGQFRAVGCVVKRDLNNDLISINNEFSVSVVIARCRQTQSGAYRWRLRLDTSLCPDITIP